jgi:hypothetical protein
MKPTEPLFYRPESLPRFRLWGLVKCNISPTSPVPNKTLMTTALTLLENLDVVGSTVPTTWKFPCWQDVNNCYRVKNDVVLPTEELSHPPNLVNPSGHNTGGIQVVSSEIMFVSP